MTDDLPVPFRFAAPPRRTTGQRAGLVAGITALVLGCVLVLGGTFVEAVVYGMRHCFWECSPEMGHRVNVRFWSHMAVASLCVPAAVVAGIRMARRTRPNA